MEATLSEARKYKLYMSLAHQYIDQIKDGDVKKAVTANINVRFVGSVGGNTVSYLHRNGEKELKQENVDRLKTGKFLLRIKQRGAEYGYLKVPSIVVNKRVRKISRYFFKRFLLQQYDLHYSSETNRPEKI